MGYSRRRYRRRRATAPFRAWGLVLIVLLVALVSSDNWVASAWVAGVLAFYLLGVRLTRCRVETVKHRPCRWLVRGLLGTCDFHVGYKRRLPVLVAADGIGLPMFMWPRPDLRSPADAVGELDPQPAPAASRGASTAPRARRSNAESVMTVLAVLSLLVACASFVRDLVAG